MFVVYKQSMNSKSAYIEKIEARLDHWKARLEQYTAQARENKADTRIRIDSFVYETKKKLDDARYRISNLRTSKGTKWDILKNRIDDGLEEIRDSFRNFATRLSV